MRIWIDTEFNGFEGELISLALVAESGEYLYVVRTAYEEMQVVPWVYDNVLPHLFKTPEGMYEMVLSDGEIQQRVSQFLCSFSDVNIIADWPEDITHLCKLMITGPGWMIATPEKFSFTVDRAIEVESDVPHNALFDAIANQKASLGGIE